MYFKKHKQQKQQEQKHSYLTVNIAVVCLLTFTTFKQVFSPVIKTRYFSNSEQQWPFEDILDICLH